MKQELIERLRQVGTRLRGSVEGLTDGDLDARPVAGKWSTRECIEHIVLVDLGWTDIFYEAVRPHHPELGKAATRSHVPGWKNDAEAKTRRSIPDALDVFDRNHREVIAYLEQLPEPAFAKEYPPVQWLRDQKIPFVIKESVNWGLNVHVDHHLAFVHEKRVALGKPLAWMAKLRKVGDPSP